MAVSALVGHDERVSTPTPAVATPRASRLTPPSWRDSRLLVGVVLVLLATLLGAKLVAGADDRTSMYAAAVPLKPGDRLDADAVRRVDVSLDEGMVAYLSAATPLPPEGFVLREIRVGELIPQAAIGTAQDVHLQPVTIRVEADSAAGLVAGSIVDVWVSPRDEETTQERYEPAVRLLGSVTVSWVPEVRGAFGATSATRAVQVLVPVDDVATVITAQGERSRFTLVPVPGSARSGG